MEHVFLLPSFLSYFCPRNWFHVCCSKLFVALQLSQQDKTSIQTSFFCPPPPFSRVQGFKKKRNIWNIWLPSSPTVLFTILKPRNTSIGVSELDKVHQSRDFEALKMLKGSSWRGRSFRLSSLKNLTKKVMFFCSTQTSFVHPYHYDKL